MNKYIIKSLLAISTTAVFMFLCQYNIICNDLYSLDKTNTEKRRECQLPNLDPLHPSILKYMMKCPPINCGAPQPALTYMDSSGTLHVNTSALHRAGYVMEDLLCIYREIKRVKDDDDKEIKHKKTKILNEFTIVRCIDVDTLKQVYETGHAFVRPLSHDLSRRSRQAHKDGAFNVLIMAIDSMSRLNFARQLPKTLNILENELQATVFKGHNKVADNTHGNIMVLLTGLASTMNCELEGVCSKIGPFWDGPRLGPFDEIPAVWKNFSSRGYVTFFAEDSPDGATFSYLVHGFKKPPTDFYMRPFWIAMENLNKTGNDSRCFGHLPKYQFLWNYTENFINKMHHGKNAFFAYSMLAELSHDNVNGIQVVDDELSSLLQRLKQSGSLDRTVVLIMGDHGQRIDTSRLSVIGRIEDRMPFLAIRVPHRLRHFREGLSRNAQVLTSWYDVYETLMDVATNNLELKSKKVRHGHHGSSLFRTVARSRTCREVGIPAEYCVCDVERDIHTDSAHAHTAARAIINHVNKLFVQEKLTSLCANLTLDFIISAQMIEQLDPIDSEFFVRTTIRTRPSAAVFEATVRIFDENIDVLGDINRINKYGNQSQCIDVKIMKPYCYCVAHEKKKILNCKNIYNDND